MGMFNEVHKTCENCGYYLTEQISQVVLGFGNFRLDHPSEISETLDSDEKERFAGMVNELTFNCKCGWSFKPHIKVRDQESSAVILI